ncbi:MAG TPA: hypothetical protein VED40_17865 [Azospirillaceae bacterium]|nr:hypothetical protein [Azospirillaceae bacterium]
MRLSAVAALALLCLGLTAVPASAQEECGKLFEGADCTQADHERALERMKDAAAKDDPAAAAAAAAAVQAPVESGAPEAANLRAQALANWEKLVRERQGLGVQCCHPGPDGEMWCH